ncbi:MAG: Rne/Rng family ribonuclease [Terriglobia bacterium]
MTKEMLISSSPHETKIALLEDDQLVEVYYERDTDVGLAGGIYKGRVSRVLPGMQSAFVDIGLERDAFLYVSDFFEDSEEYDRVFTEAENRVARLDQEGGQASGLPAESAPAKATPEPTTQPTVRDAGPDRECASSPPSPPQLAVSANAVEDATPVPPSPPEATSPANPPNLTESHHHGFQGHGRRRRGRFSEHRFGGAKSEFRDRPTEHSAEEHHHGLELLPGESLAKYGHAEPEPRAETGGSFEAQTSEIPTDLAAAEPSRNLGEAREFLFPPSAGSATAQSAATEPKGQNHEAEFGEGSHSAVRTNTRASADQETGLANFPVTRLIATSEPAVDENQEDAEAEAREEVRIDRAIPESQATSPGNSRATDTVDSLTAETGAESGPDILAEPNDGRQAPSEGTLSPEEVEPGAGGGEPATSQAENFVDEEAEAEDEKALDASQASAEGEVATEQDAGTGLPPAPSGEGVERTYTLREPHQRPRFAPRRQRRGRGRFGFRGPREGGRKNDGPRAGNFQAVQINEVLKEGQEILVQIAKEPLGNKGARITSHIALPGRYLVYMPTISHIGVSRKISSEAERLRLRNTILENRGSLTGGIIVRTAAAGRSEEELKADLRFLGTLWSDIRAKTERSKAPSLIHRDLNVVQRILRDLLSPDFKTIRIDNEIEYEQVVDFVSRTQPSLVGHVRLYTRDMPLFEEFGVQQEIDKSLKPKVWLKSGGYIVINQTEALVSIDVNTGKYVGKTNRLEDTIVKVNIDAVKEIVRQIRIRDLGGIIVIDFIDMDDRRNRNKVVQALEEALRADRAPTKILSFNEFGLVALTRKRVKQSLERTLCEPCPYCTGSGWVKSVLTVSYEIVAEARRMASQIEGKVITLRVHPDVARALKSRDGVLLSEIETATRKEIVIKSDSNVQQERFEIF